MRQRLLFPLGLCLAYLLFNNAAEARNALFGALEACFSRNVIQLEPYQDNMLDLAEVIFVSTCDHEKKAFFDAEEDPEMRSFHFQHGRIIVQQMVIATRADRLNLELN